MSGFDGNKARGTTGMRKSMTNMSLASISAILVVVALGGCSAEGGRSIADDSLPHNEVQTAPERMALAFSAGSAQLSDASARQLSAFLTQADTRRGDSIGISAGAGALDQQRRAAIADRLLAMGYKPTITESLKGGPAPLGNSPVTVTAYRYLIVPPNCPDWSKQTHLDWQNKLGSNFGCSTESDLALMVANPRDLLQGQSPTPSDGQLSAGAVERYRADKVTPLVSGASLGVGS